MSKAKEPVLIEIDNAELPEPGNAPLVPDAIPSGPMDSESEVSKRLGRMMRRKTSRLVKLFFMLMVSILLAAMGAAAWGLVETMMGWNIWLGRAGIVVLGAFVFCGVALAAREFLALVRLRKVDQLQHRVKAVMAASSGMVESQQLVDQVLNFYRSRPDLRWATTNVNARRAEFLDSDALLEFTEREMMTPLDTAALKEVEAAARQVALVTAIVPLALADLITALVANMRMVRRIAALYGGRAGSVGSWRLMRAVLLHLAASGAVSVGDDMISSVLGGGVVSKISKRFGEGVINGALTARVGVAAMEICRPMPFKALAKPRVAGVVKHALTGLFSRL